MEMHTFLENSHPLKLALDQPLSNFFLYLKKMFSLLDEADNSECISTSNFEKFASDNFNTLPISASKDMGISMSKSTSLTSRVEGEQAYWPPYENEDLSIHNNEKIITPEELR